jgi:hypothetical protein
LARAVVLLDAYVVSAQNSAVPQRCEEATNKDPLQFAA